MLRNWQRGIYAMLALAALTAPIARVGYSQGKSKDPKVVLDLDKTPPPAKDSIESTEPFGKTCSAFAPSRDGYRNFDDPVSIADLVGAPIETIRVRRYNDAKDKPDKEEARKQVEKVLKSETTEESRYEPWDEAVSANLVAKTEFFDHTKGVLEASGEHVCFSDYSGLVWWVRTTPPPETK
ncbi:MAG: hypothetical protein WA867_10515 [Candidatus Acidiferrales bacterium]